MSRERRKSVNLHKSEFGRGQTITYHNWDSLTCSLAVCVEQDTMTAYRIWNQFVQQGHTKRTVASQWPFITYRWDDKHLNHITFMRSTATSRALSQEMGSFIKQQVSARIVRRYLQQYELSVPRTWLFLLWHYIKVKTDLNGIFITKPQRMHAGYFF